MDYYKTQAPDVDATSTAEALSGHRNASIWRWYIKQRITSLHVAFTFSLFAFATAATVSQRDETNIGVKDNSRSTVALAVRVIAGSVNGDFNHVQLLSAWSSEYNGKGEIVEESLADHGRYRFRCG